MFRIPKVPASCQLISTSQPNRHVALIFQMSCIQGWAHFKGQGCIAVDCPYSLFWTYPYFGYRCPTFYPNIPRQFTVVTFMQVAYTYLMYSEFGCGQRLERSPIIYGLIHQVQYIEQCHMLRKSLFLAYYVGASLCWLLLYLCPGGCSDIQCSSFAAGDCWLFWFLHLRDLQETWSHSAESMFSRHFF